MDARYFFDWGGGLLWMSLPATGDGGAERVRRAVTQGHATLYAAPDELRATYRCLPAAASDACSSHRPGEGSAGPAGKAQPRPHV